MVVIGVFWANTIQQNAWKAGAVLQNVEDCVLQVGFDQPPFADRVAVIAVQ